MAANQSIKKIKKDDIVKIMAGAHKGKTGKVLAVVTKEQGVLIEGIGKMKRNIKPNQLNPRGGTKEIHVPIPVSKVALVVDEKSAATSRIGFVMKDGKKIRVARQAKNKEIK
ncbi:MAG TPA: 50S ribosomal protein L24 [Verrucomicrobiae bacterium]|nr:50S ribosomal protein L24 [Verrucomicrobiae bacterium]